MAILPAGRIQAAAYRVGARLPVAVVRDQQIEVPIVVVVDPAAGYGPRRTIEGTWTSQTRLLSNVAKCSVTVVVVEKITVHTGDKNVFVAVVVVVAYGGAHAVASSREPSLGGYIGETSIAIIAVEAIGICCTFLLQRRQGGAIGAKEIRPAVAVKIDDREAAWKGLDLVFAPGRPVTNDKVESSCGCSFHQNDGRLGRGLLAI